MPTCKKVYRHICENLDADFDSAQCREIRAHIESCDNCTAYLDSLKKIITLYRIYPTPHPSDRIRKELFARIKLTKANGGKH
jgi:hypothetical protein